MPPRRILLPPCGSATTPEGPSATLEGPSATPEGLLPPGGSECHSCGQGFDCSVVSLWVSHAAASPGQTGGGRSVSNLLSLAVTHCGLLKMAHLKCQ